MNIVLGSPQSSKVLRMLEQVQLGFFRRQFWLNKVKIYIQTDRSPTCNFSLLVAFSHSLFFFFLECRSSFLVALLQFGPLLFVDRV